MQIFSRQAGELSTQFHNTIQFPEKQSGFVIDSAWQLLLSRLDEMDEIKDDQHKFLISAMMDALISHFAEHMRRRKDGTDVADNVADDGEL